MLLCHNHIAIYSFDQYLGQALVTAKVLTGHAIGFSLNRS